MEEDYISSEIWVPGAYLPDYAGYCPLTPMLASPIDEEPDFWNVWTGDNRGVPVPRTRLVASPGFLVLEIAPILSEETVSKAAEATAKSLESLFASCSPNVQHFRVSTAVELEDLMKRCGFLWSHVIIIGHGAEDGLSLLDRNGPLDGADLANLLGCHDDHGRDRQIISLCCHSGCANISEALSKASNVTEVIAPVEFFDLRWAVVFVTGYFLKLFGTTGTVEQAVTEAANWSSGSKMPISVWCDGIQIS